MTLNELAHLAQQTLHTRSGWPVKRGHVHELLAAAFGHRSWAAFLSDSVLADSGVGAAPTSGLPDLIGRAVQLGYEQQAAATVAITLQAFIAEHRLSAVSLADLRAALLPAAPVSACTLLLCRDFCRRAVLPLGLGMLAAASPFTYCNPVLEVPELLGCPRNACLGQFHSWHPFALLRPPQAQLRTGPVVLVDVGNGLVGRDGVQVRSKDEHFRFA